MAHHRPPAADASPEVPAVLGPWVDGRELEDSAGQPELHPMVDLVASDGALDGPEPQPVEDRPEDHPEVQAAWASYREQWERWAAEDRRLKPVFELYKRLFDVEQLGNQLGEQFETVVGIGAAAGPGALRLAFLPPARE